MEKLDLNRSIREAKNVFPQGTPEGEVCCYVFNLLGKLGSQLDSFTLGSIASDLQWHGIPERRRAIARALDFLASGNPSVLELQYELWLDEPGNQILEESTRLSVEDVRFALENGELIVPSSGASIDNFMDLITVLYVVTEEAKQAVASEASKS